MNLDGIIQLNDAQIRNAQAQADIAAKLLEMPIRQATAAEDIAGKDIENVGKQVQNEIARQAAIKAALENLELADKITWNEQAHAHLLKIRDTALRRAKQARDRSAALSLAIHHMTRLLAGEGAWQSMRDAWVAFEDVRFHLPPAVLIKSGAVLPDAAAFVADAWLHPEHDVPTLPASHDAGSLLHWARVHTCFPKSGGAAWNYLAAVMQAMGDGAAVEAAAMEAETEAAEKAALELEARDWDRLKAG